MYEGTDYSGNSITPTPEDTTHCYYEIPVVFVIDARQTVAVLNNGEAQYEHVYGSERDAAEMLCDALQEADFRNGSEATPWLDSWSMPANQDVTGADNRSGTIVYGSDCEFLAGLCEVFISQVAAARGRGVITPDQQEQVERASRLQDYLSRYTFDGA